MKQPMQLYWVPWPWMPVDENEPDMPKPGQFVLDGADDSEMVAGFIARVDTNNERSLICLFHTVEMDLPNAEAVGHNLSSDAIRCYLDKAMKDNPAAMPAWKQLIVDSVS